MWLETRLQIFALQGGSEWSDNYLYVRRIISILHTNKQKYTMVRKVKNKDGV